MLKLYDKNKTPLKGLTKYKNLCIESCLELDDRQLSFSVPLVYANGIENECYIHTKDDEYVVKEASTEGSEMKVVAVLNLEELEGKAFRVFKSEEQPIDKALSLAFAGTGWRIENHGITKKRTLSMSNVSAVAILKQAINTYRVEIKIDSINKIVHIYEAIGSDKGAYFTSELNLKKLSLQSTSYDFYTRIEPYGKDGLTIEEVNGGKAYLENYRYADKAKTYIWKDERYTVAESLMEDARYKLEDMAKPYKSFGVDVCDLARISKKYSILEYGIGDTIALHDVATGTREKQRIIAMKNYPDSPDKNSCEVANRQMSFEEMAQKYAEAADTVQNITNDNGQVDGDAIDGIHADQIIDLGNAIISEAVIKDLTTKYLEVTGKLTAVEADIGILNATSLTATEAEILYLKVEDAKIKYATIEDTQITNAKITNLEAITGQITTLLSGNAGIGELQNIHLTSQNAVIEEALIKNAVINSVAVGDLMAGDISTNKFRIVSDDGGIVIAGATQQWKDKNGVIRMQAGRDAHGDFTFSLFGPDGVGILIDADGIHADAVPDGLIVDGMVSNDANISGSKLDIHSVVEEINNGATTIKSTKIYLDETGQSLSVAFNNMTTEVNGAKNDVADAVANINSWESRFTTNETAIRVMQGKINVLISESEMQEIQGSQETVYSKFHAIETTVDGFSSTISSMRTDVNRVISNFNSLRSDVNSFKSTISSTVSTVDGKVTSMQSSITQMSGEIDLKVNKNGLISSINNSGESIKINTDRLDITANGLVNIINSGTTKIAASKINLNGLVTANNYFKINLDGSMEATSGKIGGWQISDIDLIAISADGQNRVLLNSSIGARVGVMYVQTKNGPEWTHRLRLDYDGKINFYDVLGLDSLAISRIDNYALTMQNTLMEDKYKLTIRADSINAQVNSVSYIYTSRIKPTTGSPYMSITLRGRVSVDDFISSQDVNADRDVNAGRDALIQGDLLVRGKKTRAVKTEHYGEVEQNAYETCCPMFGDVGHAVIGKDGKSTISIDSVFVETISLEYGYYIFLTKYGQGEIWIENKSLTAFTVGGTPGLEFDWELKAHQKDYETDRLTKVKRREGDA